MAVPSGAAERPLCKTQCAPLSLFTCVSSALVLFFHFNFKMVIDHYCGHEPRQRHNLPPSFQGWQEVEMLKESTVHACVEGQSRLTAQPPLQLIQGRTDSHEGTVWPDLWKYARPCHTVIWWVFSQYLVLTYPPSEAHWILQATLVYILIFFPNEKC